VGEQALIATQQGDEVVKAVTSPTSTNLAETLTKEEMAKRIARMEKRYAAQKAVDEARVEAETAVRNLEWGLKDLHDAKSLTDLCFAVRVTSAALRTAIKEYMEYADASLEQQERAAAHSD
jgi:hypothetical protein